MIPPWRNMLAMKLTGRLGLAPLAHAGDDVGAVEAPAEGRRGEEVAGLGAAAVHVPADEVLADGRIVAPDAFMHAREIDVMKARA